MVTQKRKDPLMSSILGFSCTKSIETKYGNITVSLMNRPSLTNFYLVGKEDKITDQSIIKGIFVQCINVARFIKIALDVTNILQKCTYFYI